MSNLRILSVRPFSGYLFLLFVYWIGLSPVLAAELELMRVAYEPVDRVRAFDGVIEAVNQATVAAEVAGRVEAILYDVDDYVAQGDIILRFRDPEQRARLDQARATLKEADARYREAQAEHRRIEEIFGRQLVSRSAMDKAAAELKAARARLDSAAAGVVQAEEQLEHTLVRAPYSGIVTRRHVEVGETASIGMPLISGISLDELRAVVDVPQGVINDVRTHGVATIILPDGKRIGGSGLTVFPYADTASHSFKVRVRLAAEHSGLYPGELVKVEFAVGRDHRLLVPQRAVIHRSEVTAVYVLYEDGRAALRQIRTGRISGDRIEVLAGLEEGEQVALDPIQAGVYLKGQSGGQ